MAQFFVDGQNLDDAESRWFVDYSALLPAVGARDVASLRLPGRSSVTVRRQGWSEGSLKLAVNVPPALSLPGGVPVEASESRVRLLKALLARAQVLTMDEGGVTRSVDVVGVSVSDPSRVARDAWRVSVDFTVQPFWWEPGTITPESSAVPGDVLFAEWAGSTGDVQDGVLRFRGPFTRLAVTAPDGTGFSYEGSDMDSSRYLYVDVAEFRAWRSTATAAWSPNTQPRLLDYPAGGPLRLTPGADGVALSVSGEGFDLETSGVVLRGRKWWL